MRPKPHIAIPEIAGFACGDVLGWVAQEVDVVDFLRPRAPSDRQVTRPIASGASFPHPTHSAPG
ncbi:hypothetical protein ACIBCA_37000, partial [Kitasatospora sp. NPDC051170]|uniref:hypothetical protein n=1 Tax=Kitasatospora sp. NPDC051170 TaxID=3364056 RepID=UPI00378DD4A0